MTDQHMPQAAPAGPNGDPVLKADFQTDGTILVEASAGTGKTYTIETLYLRLIALQGLTVQEILVVTFTEAAAKELRDRLRTALVGLAEKQEKHDARAAALYALAGGEREKAKLRIRRALLDFDEAAIYTIHGFCRRVLHRYAVECGAPLEAELVPETDGLVSAACTDWWRRNSYGASEERMNLLDAAGCIPKTLSEVLEKRICKPDARLEPDFFAGRTFEDAVQNIEQRLALFDSKPMQDFLDACEDLKNLISNTKASGFTWKNGRIAHTKTDKENPGGLDACLSRIKTTWEGDGKGTTSARATWNKITQGVTACKADDIIDVLERLSGWLQAPEQEPEFIVNLKCIPLLKEKNKPVEILLKKSPLGKALQAAAIEEIRKYYHETKRKAHIITFDDLLLDLRRALTEGEESAKNRILNAIRGEYKIALIDEFQDTDPVQYRIFSAIFKGDRPLFLVGDPKQAIYGFRSGDIFTYKAASANAKKKISRDTNRRSEKNLVEAVNQMFRDRACSDGIRYTFLHGDWIRYAGDLKAQGKEPAESLYTDGAPDAAPFRLWCYPAQTEKEVIYADTAEEIVRILNDARQTFGPAGREIRPADIAVLVHTHNDADAIALELLRRRVPVVKQKTGNVFDTPEAADMALLLAAMAEPRDATRVRSALACRAMALSDSELKRLIAGGEIPLRPAAGGNAQGAEQWMIEAWIAFFDELHELWANRSFIAAFNRFAETVGLRARAVKAGNGERRLTNLLQLAGLIHRAASEKRLSIEAVLTWLARQRSEDTRDVSEEEYEMRLETDEDAVKIMTIFKSKGLQFPIVFVPTLWRKVPGQGLGSQGQKTPALEYHEPSRDAGPECLVLNLDTGNDAGEKKHLEERLAEDIRLLYVACTRAINRVYLAYNNVKKNPSALDFVLGAGEESDLNIAKRTEQIEKHLKNGLPPENPLHIKVEERNPVEHTPLYYQPRNAQPAPTLQTEGQRSGAPVVNKKYGHASFTSLAPHDLAMPAALTHQSAAAHEIYMGADSAKDHDELDGAGTDSGADPAAGEEKKSLTILSFPAGTRTGTCWHKIFEELDFNAGDDQIRNVVNEQLAIFRLDKGSQEISRRKRELVAEMVCNTLRLPLPVLPGKSDAGTFALKDIDSSKRSPEFMFHFSLPDREQDTTAILEVLKKHWQKEPDDSSKKKLLNVLEQNWTREIPRGFMTGSIDLFFEHNGRYYIIDWKSNRLDRFDCEALRQEMCRRAYHLQYLFYITAVHNYLLGCKSDYNYDRHFGAVFYIFLRGTDNSETKGIYADRPGRELIEELSGVLGDFSSEKETCA